MIHDQARVDSTLARATAQIGLIRSLKAKVTRGNIDALDVALKQTEEVASDIVERLGRATVIAAEEAAWLSLAEQILDAWQPYLKAAEMQFAAFGDSKLEAIG